jgi:hypothetical protein
MTRPISTLLAGALVLGPLLAACGSDDGSSTRSGAAVSGSASGSGTGAECTDVGKPDQADVTVGVTLREWSVRAGRTEVPVHRVAFKADNKGSEKHELVVVKGDSVEALPKGADGALDETKLPKGALIGELENIYPAASCIGEWTLEPGNYVLLCNIVEDHDGKTISHLKEGMATPFRVT